MFVNSIQQNFLHPEFLKFFSKRHTMFVDNTTSEQNQADSVPRR